MTSKNAGLPKTAGLLGWKGLCIRPRAFINLLQGRQGSVRSCCASVGVLLLQRMSTVQANKLKISALQHTGRNVQIPQKLHVEGRTCTCALLQCRGDASGEESLTSSSSSMSAPACHASA